MRCVSCVFVNGRVTGSLGNVNELMVCCTFRSSLLLKFGSSGNVDMDWKCCAMMSRLSIGVMHGGSFGWSGGNGGRG